MVSDLKDNPSLFSYSCGCYEHTVTDCPKSGATQMQNEGKKSDGDLRLRVLYCTSNPFLSPEQMLVSASADTVAGRHETSNLGVSSLLN